MRTDLVIAQMPVSARIEYERLLIAQLEVFHFPDIQTVIARRVSLHLANHEVRSRIRNQRCTPS